MNTPVAAIVAIIAVLILIIIWSAFIGGECSKDSQCPAGHACLNGKCAPKGSFTNPPARISEPFAGRTSLQRERLDSSDTRDLSGKRAGRITTRGGHHPLMIGVAPLSGRTH